MEQPRGAGAVCRLRDRLESTAWNVAVTAGVWQQITMSYSAGVATCYVNGTQVATTSASCNAGRTNDWVFTLGNFDGDIDEVRISNIAARRLRLKTDC
jgi:hypothetical protein